MARSAPIILNPGIQAGVPFTVGGITMVTAAAPTPTIADSRLRQLTDAVSSVTAQATTGVDSFVLGRNANNRNRPNTMLIGADLATSGDASELSNILIGSTMDPGAAAINFTRNIFIGFTNTVPTGAVTSHAGNNIGIGSLQIWSAVQNTVAVGNSITITGDAGVGVGVNLTVGPQSVTIGNAGVGAGTQSVQIGQLTLGAGNNGVAVGYNSRSGNNGIGIGFQSRGDGDSSLAIGRDADTGGFNDCIVLGRAAIAGQANNCLIGSTTHFINRCIIGAGYTPTGYGGLTLEFSSASAGANIAAADTTIKGGASTGSATGGAIKFFVGTVLGAGSTYQTPVEVLALIPSLKTAGNPSIRFTNQVSSPGASVGTLNNAPAAGDPTIWAEVLYNGVLRKIPMW